MRKLKHRAQAVQDALDRAGLPCQVVELSTSTRTAKEAAAAIGCTVAQIAKSIVFRTQPSSRAVLVIVSGKNRVDESAVASQLGEPIVKASPEFVRNATGYVIGGVPPCGHSGELSIFVDSDLLALPEIWAAAGTPNAVFSLKPDQLVRLTGGCVLRVRSGRNSRRNGE